MPDRIFPSTEQKLGSEKELNIISLDDLAARLASSKGDDSTRMSPELRAQFERIAKKDEEDKEAEESDAKEDSDGDGPPSWLKDKWSKWNGKSEKEAAADTQKSAKQLPPAFLENIKKKKGEGEDKKDESDEDEFVKEAGVRQRKIRFTDPSQISADAVIAAKQAGDEHLVNAIIAARQDRRVRLASKLQDETKEQIDKQQKVAKRHDFRINVIKKTAQVAETLGGNKPAKTASTDGFKKIAHLDNVEKDAFLRKIVANGFPEEYAIQMLGIKKAERTVSASEQALRDVIASDMSETTKRTVVSSMLKEAHLTSEEMNHAKNYWLDVLGYKEGDAKGWVEDLFTQKYD
jgi:hypothetical protein